MYSICSRFMMVLICLIFSVLSTIDQYREFAIHSLFWMVSCPRDNRAIERFNWRFLRDDQVARPMDLYNKIDWAIYSLPRYLTRVGPLCYSILSDQTQHPWLWSFSIYLFDTYLGISRCISLIASNIVSSS